MSLKTETITVRLCDDCASVDRVRTCDHCGKDICPLHGYVYELFSKGWLGSGGLSTSSLNFASAPLLVSATLCKACERALLSNLAAFRFQFIAAEPIAKSA